MQSISDRLAAYKPKEAPPGRAYPFWMTYAAKVCKDFKIDKPLSGIIWRHAKRNLGYLQGKVALAEEKAAMNSEPVERYGHYLISLFRKVKPWEQ